MCRIIVNMYIDPKQFISSPYIKCPKCNKSNTFGILWISGNSYSRRCRNCSFIKNYRLPKLKKKIIYLDQFVISEMMKSINKDLGKEKRVNPFWLDLFKTIERLLKLQLAIYPSSTFHKDESALYKFKAHKIMYEHLSNGTRFYDESTIRRFQISDYFRQFIKGNNKPEIKLKTKQVTSGHINDWQERFGISLNQDITMEEKNQLRIAKEKADKIIPKLFKKWKAEQNRNFDDWFFEEGMAYGNNIVNKYFNNLTKYNFWDISLVLSEENILIRSLENHLPETKDKDTRTENRKKIFDFILSDRMLGIPSIRISALLWAAIADSVAHGGRKKLIKAGIINDINMVASLLPYCDAIFVDREIYGLLNHPEVKKEIVSKYKTRIFSTTNKNKFLKYLNNIEKNANKNHLKKVKEIYGNNWPRPFLEIYDYYSKK